MSGPQTPELSAEPVDVAPWERQPQESDPAWEAFKKYRDLGAERSLSEVSRQLSKSLSTISEWSRRYSWRERLYQWNVHEDRMHQEWVVSERRAAAKRQARTASALNRTWLTALQGLNPDKLTPSEMAKFAELALKMERSALLMDDNTLNVQVSGKVDHVHGLSPNDTQARIEALRRELEERARETSSLPDNGYEDVVDEPTDADVEDGDTGA